MYLDASGLAGGEAGESVGVAAAAPVEEDAAGALLRVEVEADELPDRQPLPLRAPRPLRERRLAAPRPCSPTRPPSIPGKGEGNVQRWTAEEAGLEGRCRISRSRVSTAILR